MALGGGTLDRNLRYLPLQISVMRGDTGEALAQTEHLLKNENANVNGFFTHPEMPPIHFAINHGYPGQMEVLLKYKADIWQELKTSTIPNAYQKEKNLGAVGQKHTALNFAVEKNNVKPTKLLFAIRGDSIREKQQAYEDAILLAATLGHIDIVKIFLQPDGIKKNASTNVNDPMFATDADYKGLYKNKLLLCAAKVNDEEKKEEIIQYLINLGINTTGYQYNGGNLDIKIKALLQDDNLTLDILENELCVDENSDYNLVADQIIEEIKEFNLRRQVLGKEIPDAGERGLLLADMKVQIQPENFKVPAPRIALAARILYARHLSFEKFDASGRLPEQIKLHQACDLWRQVAPEQISTQDNFYAGLVFNDEKNALSFGGENYFDTQIRALNHFKQAAQKGHIEAKKSIAKVTAHVEPEEEKQKLRSSLVMFSSPIKDPKQEDKHFSQHLELLKQRSEKLKVLDGYAELSRTMNNVLDYLIVRQKQTGTYTFGFSEQDYKQRQAIAAKLAGLKCKFEKSIEFDKAGEVSVADSKHLDDMVAEIDNALRSSSITGRWGCISSHRFADQLHEMRSLIGNRILKECSVIPKVSDSKNVDAPSL